MRGCVTIIMVLLLLGACSKSEKEGTPEKTLLMIFKTEEALVKEYQNDYVGYMRYQVVNFVKKNQLISKTIKAINLEFEKLDENQKKDYQMYWQERFQPVIDNIHAETRQMIITQTQSLNQKTMATIQRLSTKMELLEKEMPLVQLEPRFFGSPAVKEDLNSLVE